MNPTIHMIASILDNPFPLQLIAAGLLLALALVLFSGMVRDARKEEEKYTAAQKNLKAGDIVVTPAGITGEVLDIRRNTLKIRSGDTVLEIRRNNVSIPNQA